MLCSVLNLPAPAPLLAGVRFFATGFALMGGLYRRKFRGMPAGRNSGSAIAAEVLMNNAG
ncbi:MAG: hypothetical protein L0H94_00825 [Nitrospira sp.]|nr:hypothetical protein [Nitrospira sp.]